MGSDSSAKPIDVVRIEDVAFVAVNEKCQCVKQIDGKEFYDWNGKQAGAVTSQMLIRS